VVGDIGPRFENHVALSLLKSVYARNDCLGESLELKYLRTKEGREVDFCLCRDQIIEVAIEAKSGRDKISPGLVWFCKKYNLNGIQVVKDLRREQSIGKIEIRSAGDFLSELYL